MKKRIASTCIIAAVAAVSLASNFAFAEDAAPGSAAAPASTAAAGVKLPPEIKIDPRVEQLLNRSCDGLAPNSAFTFHAEITFDKVLPSGVKLQFAAAADYAVQRPDKFAVDFQGDLGGKKVWYSGDQATIFDPPHMVYATASAPPSIDGMLDRLEQDHNLSIPLANLAYSNPCQKLMKGIDYAAYIGVNDVDGEDCDHLALTRNNLDWQIWLQRTGKHLPRKIVINYRKAPGSPEYAAVLSDWKFPQSIPASTFRPDLPKEAKRIDIAKVKETKP